MTPAMPGAAPAPVTVTQEDSMWIVTLVRANGKVQRFECATEAQARKLATTMSLGARGK